MNTLTFSHTQKAFMKRALALARKARGKTSPNPMVGALIVKAGKVIAEDYHRMAGQPHAEALALRKAGRAAEGADLYVTLEPCCHINKRTPPCTKAIIESKIKRVFVAMTDPNPMVSGCGLKELQQAGIEVYWGLLEEEAKRLNEAYIKHITTGKPFVILKTAMTLDGKIADPFGNSKWITSEASRRQVHRIRGTVDAILTAKGTVLKDNPLLTARLRGYKNPIRVLIDPALEVPEDYNIFNREAKTLVFYSEKGLSSQGLKRLQALTAKGVETIASDQNPIPLEFILQRLGQRGVTSVLIEGGASLNGRAISEGIVDKVIFFIAPKIFCAKGALNVIVTDQLRSLKDAIELTDLEAKKIGRDIVITGYCCKA